ncbi:staphylopine family metallophore export MFS transporter CntE [Heyndrickxia sp. NPDC080065]|uniref:staphylopine family metallophore export MFS transporter CntE n=1 Tax=Heyndrickxia sp. NPDC080065 TaxID=3390568 RepID=UPI003D020CE4
MKQNPLSIKMLQIYGLAMAYFTANAVLSVVFPLQAATHGIREAEIGLMMGIYMFVCMFLRPWAGQMITKYSVFTIMKWLLIAHAITLLLYSWLGINSIYIVRILQGIVTAFFSMAMQMGITEVLYDKDRGQGLAMYSLSTVIPSIYGPVLALFLWHQQSASWLPIFVVILALIPLLLFIRSPLSKTRQEHTTFTLEECFQGIKLARQHKGLVFSSIVMLCGACIFGAISTFLPLYLLTSTSLSPAFYLFSQAIVVVSSRFIFRKYIPSDGKWHSYFIAIILGCSIIGTTMLAMLPILGAFVYISAIFNGIATAMLYPTLTTYISFVIPDSHRHILLGIFLASYDLGFSLGGFIMGFIIQWGSYAIMFSCCSLLAVIILIYNYFVQIPKDALIHE